jgi:hypothetical protein
MFLPLRWTTSLRASNGACIDNDFPLPNDFVGRPHVVELRAFLVLDFEQPVDAGERNATIVADYAAPTICVR